MKNFLIIESGSTKADWAFVTEDNVLNFASHGINLATSAGLNQKLDSKIIIALSRVDNIFFYGAGSNISNAQQIIKKYLNPFVSSKVNLQVESDILAAARACAGNNEAIICILGTGSNSCIYDGNTIVNNIPSLGYILSDEGSGNHIGKEILKAFFYQEMSTEDHTLFNKKYALNRGELLHKIYKEDRVSAYLAEFSLFLNICTNTLKIRILTKVFNEFIEIRIKKYANFSNFDIYFVGSIASAFEEELKIIMHQQNLQIKKVIKNPIQNLILYHKSRED